MASTTARQLAAARYGRIAIAFHWILALAIVASFSFGLYMVELPFSPARIKQYNWHKWAGVSILVLSAARLLWRLFNKPPALSGGPAWQHAAAHGTHGLLYALFFLVPLAGWAYSSAAGFPVVYFGVWPLPDWVAADPQLAGQLKPVHRWLAYSLAAVTLAHVAAALKHHFIDRDDVMTRMRPF